jgi:DNA-binding transcriptional regulator YhcF (GntR family)
MSLDATRWAWTRTVGRASAKLVLLAIADRAGADHTSYPSIARIEDDTELDRKTVMAAVAYLEEKGLIEAGRRSGVATHYRLIGVEERARTSTKNGTSPEIGTSTKNGTQPVPKTGLDQYQKRDTNLSITNQEPENTSAAREKAPKANGLDLSPLPPITVSVWRDYLTHRKAIKAPLTTQTALNRLATKLHEIAAAGITPDEALSIAIEKGWRSVELEWITNSKQRTPHHETTQGSTPRGSVLDRVKARNRAAQIARGEQPELRIVTGERLD